MDQTADYSIGNSNHNLNNTDGLTTPSYALTAWDHTHYIFIIIFTLLGLIADILLIYVIVRNAQLRSKTNLVLMNIAIVNLCFLLVNMHLQAAVLHLFGISNYIMKISTCAIQLIDVSLEFAQIIFVIMFISSSIMQSSEYSTNVLVFTGYFFGVGLYLVLEILCYKGFRIYRYIHAATYYPSMLLFFMILFKQIRNCYKKWWLKESLDKIAQFRLNIAWIFALINLFIHIMFNYSFEVKFRDVVYVMVEIYLLESVFILIYVICADTEFKKCFMSVFKKGSDHSDDTEENIELAK